MYRNKIVITILLTLFHLLSPVSDTEAYERTTHRDLSNIAIQNSYLSDTDYLKSIGINSIAETFNNKRIHQWIELGADEEDSWFRPINHFHNPLRLWSVAGLNDFFVGESSLLWTQDVSNEFSWQNARQYFSDALTSSSAESRETGFANMFETLGHLLHLVQDSSCPPHTRNDAHVLVASGYEGWANNHPDAVSNYASPFSVAVDLGVSGEGYEPITQFFDTNQYMGFAPSTSNTQGLAEYTSANFASEDTIFTENFFPDHIHYFPFPRRADTEEYDQDMGGRLRTYFRKVQNGEAIEHFAVAGRFYRYLPWWPEVQIYFIGFDKLCHADYALKLIPPAVGYSVALLDYFFRGEIDLIENPDNPDGYVIENKKKEEMYGTFELYYDNIEGERVKLPGENGDFPVKTLISAGGKSGNIDFTPPDDAKEPCKYILVFRGQMGSETDAVVGKVVDGIKACANLLIYLSCSPYVSIWDVAKGTLAQGVTDNDGDVVTFPVLASEITDWLDTKTGASLDGLYGEETESDTGAIPPGSGSSTYEPYSEPCVGGYTATQDYSWTGVLGGANHVTVDQESAWVSVCNGGTGTVTTSNSGAHSYMRHSGKKLTAVNASSAVLKFYKSVQTEREQSTDGVYSNICSSCSTYWGTTCESSVSVYSQTLAVLSYTAYGLNLGTSNQTSDLIDGGCSGVSDWVYTGDVPIIRSVNVSYSAVYSEDYSGVMIQIFSANDGRGSYTFYGQAESGIDDVNTQSPTALNKTTGLTTAMQALSDLVGGAYVSALYLGKEES